MKSEAVKDNAEGVVYIGQPALIGLQSEAALLKIKPAQIRSNLTGQYLSRFKGRGMEFAESRPYQPGDDIRSMDWRVTARTSKAHSKVFREERERPVLVWVDFCPSMFFATRVCFKSVLAARLAAIIAWKASQLGDRLGALLFSQSKHLELRPGRGKTAVLRLIKHLAEFSQNLPRDAASNASTLKDEDHALNRLVQVTRPGSLIYLMSDFRHLSQQLASTLSRLSTHNEVVLLHIHDPLESSLPQSGYYRVSDGQNEATVNASDNQVKQQYHQRFIEQQQQLIKLCQKYRTAYRSASTDQSPLDILRQIAKPTRGAT